MLVLGNFSDTIKVPLGNKLYVYFEAKKTGAIKTDPHFDEMLEDIAQLRSERNAEMADYYDRLDEA